MKYQIRKGVFETNSSSTHSLCICLQEDFDAWKSGKTLFNEYKNEFRSADDFGISVTDKEVEDYYNNTKQEFYKSFESLTPDEVEKVKDRLLAELRENADMDDFESYEDWCRDYLEAFEKSYTSKSGDKIVVFGQYGYDG